MKNVTYFKDFFESVDDYRKIVLLLFLIQNDDDLLEEYGFVKSNNNRLNKEFKNILLEQNEEYLDYIRNEKQKKMKIF